MNIEIPKNNRHMMVNAEWLLSRTLIILAILWFCVTIGLLWSFTVDDTFISLRYAKNWVEWGGLTWNKGYAPVEGYTSILWILVLAIPHHLTSHPVLAAKILSLASTAGLLVVCCLFTRLVSKYSEQSCTSLAAAASVMFVATWPPTSVHAVSGMETALYALLLCSFAYALTQSVIGDGWRRRRAWVICLGIIGLLLGLCRPEGNLVVIAGFLSAIVLQKVHRKYVCATLVLCYVIPGLAYLFWRIHYYQHILPLPFYIKALGGGLFAGKLDVLSFLFSIAVSFGFLLVVAAINLPRIIVPACICCLIFVVFFLFPSHVMGYDWRFLYPVFPVVAVVAALGFGRLADWLQKDCSTFQNSPLKWAVLLLAASLVVPFGFVEQARHVIRDRRAYASGLESAHIRLARCLSVASKGDPGKFLLAVADAGAIPYMSGWRAIDTFGLNDNTIAITGTRDPNYVMSQKPDIVILLSKSDFNFVPRLSWENDLFSECERQNMMKIGALKFADHYFLWVMGDPRSSLVSLLKNRLSIDSTGDNHH